MHTRTPLRSTRSPAQAASHAQPFPVGTWVSQPSLTSSNGKDYGFVLAHIIDKPKGTPKKTMPTTFMRVLWANSEYLDVPAHVWSGYEVALGDSGLNASTKRKVWSKIKTSFRTSSSPLGQYIHALTPHQWQQLGMEKPTQTASPIPRNTPAPTVTSNPAPVAAVTPTPMSTDLLTGVRRGRDFSAPASQRSSKHTRTNSASGVPRSNNPFHLPQGPDDMLTLPATLHNDDDDYGADWDEDMDPDQYDNATAVAVYEGAALPTTNRSHRGRRSVPRAPL